MQATFPRSTSFVWLAAVAASCVVAVAMVNAVRWYDHPVAGLLLTSDLEVPASACPTGTEWPRASRIPTGSCASTASISPP